MPESTLSPQSRDYEFGYRTKGLIKQKPEMPLKKQLMTGSDYSMNKHRKYIMSFVLFKVDL
jgi:hypothetical protein